MMKKALELSILITGLITLFFTVISCSKEDVGSFKMRINHYQQTAIGSHVQLVFLTQEDSNIGSDKWNYFYSNIKGFDYELGYVYDIEVDITEISNPPQDASAYRYELKKIIHKKKVNVETTFEIRLKPSFSNESPHMVTGNSDKNYKILNQIEIDCADQCEKLEQMLMKEEKVTGLFKHANGKIELVEILAQ